MKIHENCRKLMKFMKIHEIYENSPMLDENGSKFHLSSSRAKIQQRGINASAHLQQIAN